ncbi:peroxynitrite isomerase THAP4-like [Cotesia glomerata]|nr:peroxynitrite isomerase THAP4-like [Cotesia glomerata]XP_044589357.1 peroxynitrite isomerase THAP4-like [Cotesia glomerata]XP_044589366.1 peroxynitrite isomerase THAP4-like [Cotesia glomerata]XP_044589375.1 peroxynitrite isomerase THAP4-like [Cotesia glomerata]XP_044589383.1 peroxynitrite isomerase THAP4-like [Cotesia glomerata]XP_044589391.1 peroxynitrite isomerase THAP4-like [Cotesia glomerata]
MNRLPVHNALKSLSWLEGTWRTEVPGEGKFPTIKPFGYLEEIKFTSIGQPMLNYEAQSWHPEKKNPMHREVGFLKIIPGTNKVKLILSHNFGLATIEEGVVDRLNIKLDSTSVCRVTEGTKDPAVTRIKREFIRKENSLEQVIYMTTSNTQELTEHLRATYIKID